MNLGLIASRLCRTRRRVRGRSADELNCPPKNFSHALRRSVATDSARAKGASPGVPRRSCNKKRFRRRPALPLRTNRPSLVRQTARRTRCVFWRARILRNSRLRAGRNSLSEEKISFPLRALPVGEGLEFSHSWRQERGCLVNGAQKMRRQAVSPFAIPHRGIPHSRARLRSPADKIRREPWPLRLASVRRLALRIFSFSFLKETKSLPSRRTSASFKGNLSFQRPSLPARAGVGPSRSQSEKLASRPDE